MSMNEVGVVGFLVHLLFWYCVGYGLMSMYLDRGGG